MKKPLLGLTGPSGFSNQCFKMIEKFFDANFVPLPHENEANLQYWMQRCDGFIVAGGVDVHPSLYGQSVLNQQSLSKFDMQRDLRELQVIHFCIQNKKPLLGICRGHQLIGIALGLGNEFVMDLNSCATIHQPNTKNGIVVNNEHDVLHWVEVLDADEFPMEEVTERKVLNTILGENTKDRKIWVNSFHHQGILHNSDRRHYQDRNIKVIGIASAELDKKRSIIEVMRGESWISAQWHPEYDYEHNTPSRTVLNLFKLILTTGATQHGT